MSRYCSGCYRYDWCKFPCKAYLNYLSVIAECLNGSPHGTDPCDHCTNKYQWDCPLFGDEKQMYGEYQDQLEQELSEGEVGEY